MAQPVTGVGDDLKPKPRTSSRVSNALKTGVVYGGSAVLTAVNNITPHIAGAVDVLVIEQPNGTRKATPFYVRFGKYTALRARERNVKLFVNDELAPFGMHIGTYGQAYFATETIEVRDGDDDEQDALLVGMMSPPSGYSSGGDEPSPQQLDSSEPGATLSAVRQRIDGMKDIRRGSGRSANAPSSGSRGSRVPVPALGTVARTSGASPVITAALQAPSAVAASPGLAPALGSGERYKEGHGSKVQLAPAMSLADRNESFLSARETLTTPLGDELVSSALGPISPAVPGSPELAAQHAGAGCSEAMGPSPAPQGTHAMRASTDSLGTVSEGASPCGWSEDEEEQEQNEGSPERSWQSPPPRSSDLEARNGMPVGEGMAPPPEAKQELRPPPLQLQPLPAASAAHHMHPRLHPYQHQGGFQQPLHRQFGFPENTSLGVSATDSQCPIDVAGALDDPDPEAAVHSAVAAVSVSPQSCTAGFDAGTRSCASLQPGAGPRLQGAIDWGQVLGGAPNTESNGATASAVPIAPRDAVAVSLALLPPPRPHPHAAAAISPGTACGALSAAAADGNAPGSGPGSHSAVSLLSSSLRSGAGEGRSVVPPVGSRPSVDWLRAQDAGEMESGFLQLPAEYAVPQASSAPTGAHVGPIAAAAAAARPRAEAETLPTEGGVRLSLTVLPSSSVRVGLSVLPQPVPATAAAGRKVSHGSFIDREATAGPELGSGTLAAASDSGYLGDEERATVAAAATPVPLHHHGSHHHHYHCNHHHNHGHSRREDHDLHSTSAPLPSRAAIGAAAATKVADQRHAAAAAGIAPRAATSVHGIELSLCGGHLNPSMPYSGACALFDAHRVSEDAFFSRAQHLSAAADLVIRLSNGVMYPCQPLSYSLLGLLAFGTWRLPAGTPCWAPEGVDAVGAGEAAATAAAAAAAAAAMLAAAVAQGAGAETDATKNGAGSGGAVSSSAATTPKKGQTGAGTASWRLWMFGSRREGTRTSATGGGGVGVPFIGGRSPPLSSPNSDQQGPLAHRTSTGVDVRSPPPMPSAGAALPPPPPPSQSYAPEGISTAAAGAAESSAGGALPIGSSTGGAAAASQDKGSQRQAYNVVTKKSLTPSPEQLAALPLKHGQNTITYKVGASELRAYVYFLPWRTRIVISDIDGTITKSDVLGHLLPAMGLDWSHPGIAELLTNIRQNNYLIMYLSSRSISQANITRDFINTLVQGEHRMPLGPVIISPHGLLPSLYREMILRRPHEFKIATLQDIRALFPPDWNPFYGGFGNRDTDEISYREVGVQPSRIFIINPRGELRQPMEPRTRVAAAAGSPAGRAATAAAPADAKTQGHEDAEKPSEALSGPVASTDQPPAEMPAAAQAPGAAAAREVQGRSASGRALIGRRASGTLTPAASSSTTITTTTVALSTLSAINELVHDIFPPLRDGEPVMSDDEDRSSGGAEADTDGGRADKDEQNDTSGSERGGDNTGRSGGGRPSGEECTGEEDARSTEEHYDRLQGVAGDQAGAPALAEGASKGAAAATEDDLVTREVSSEDHWQTGTTLPAATPRSAASPRSPPVASVASAAAEPQGAAATAISAGSTPVVEVDMGEALRADAGPLNLNGFGAETGAATSLRAAGQAKSKGGDGAASCVMDAACQQAVSSGCSAGSPGSPGSGGPGTAVVDEVVATAVPLPA